MTEQNTPKGRERRCWNCGANMGWIADKYYDRRDTCESRECSAAALDADREERERAHEQLDMDRGWDRWR